MKNKHDLICIKPKSESAYVIMRDLFFCCWFFFLGPHLQHREVPRLGVKLELKLLATARDQTCILMDTSLVHYHWDTMGTLRELSLSAQCVSPQPLLLSDHVFSRAGTLCVLG